MLMFKMAFRHIVRHRRRSILSGLAMGIGALLFSFSYGMSEGMYGNIIALFTKESVGHVQLYDGDYLDSPAIYKSIVDYEGIISKLKKDSDEVVAVTSRIYLNSLAFYNKKSSGVKVVGVDLATETQATALLSKKMEGRLPQELKYEVIVSKKISTQLKIKLGDKLVLIGQGADGSIANDLFSVVGIADYSGSMMGDAVVLSDLKTIQEFATLHGRVHAIVVRLKHHRNSRIMANQFREHVDKKLTVYPWEESEDVFYKSMETDKQGNYVTLFIIMFVVALGVLNAVFMNVYERMREYATMKSIGATPLQIFCLIIIESVMLAIISLIPALILAFLVNYYFTIYGISVHPIEYGGITISKMTSTLAPRVFIVPSLVVIVMSIISSILPAITAAMVNPCKLMRRN